MVAAVFEARMSREQAERLAELMRKVGAEPELRVVDVLEPG
jgi:hypothetical protein